MTDLVRKVVEEMFTTEESSMAGLSVFLNACQPFLLLTNPTLEAKKKWLKNTFFNQKKDISTAEVRLFEEFLYSTRAIVALQKEIIKQKEQVLTPNGIHLAKLQKIVSPLANELVRISGKLDRIINSPLSSGLISGQSNPLSFYFIMPMQRGMRWVSLFETAINNQKKKTDSDPKAHAQALKTFTHIHENLRATTLQNNAAIALTEAKNSLIALKEVAGKQSVLEKKEFALKKNKVINEAMAEIDKAIKGGYLNELGTAEELTEALIYLDSRTKTGKRKEREPSLLDGLVLESLEEGNNNSASHFILSLSAEKLIQPNEVLKALRVAQKLKSKGMELNRSKGFNLALHTPEVSKGMSKKEHQDLQSIWGSLLALRFDSSTPLVSSASVSPQSLPSASPQTPKQTVRPPKLEKLDSNLDNLPLLSPVKRGRPHDSSSSSPSAYVPRAASKRKGSRSPNKVVVDKHSSGVTFSSAVRKPSKPSIVKKQSSAVLEQQDSPSAIPKKRRPRSGAIK
jgi:uncharacterized protein YehS (DUF1456 family)